MLRYRYDHGVTSLAHSSHEVARCFRKLPSSRLHVRHTWHQALGSREEKGGGGSLASSVPSPELKRYLPHIQHVCLLLLSL